MLQFQITKFNQIFIFYFELILWEHLLILCMHLNDFTFWFKFSQLRRGIRNILHTLENLLSLWNKNSVVMDVFFASCSIQ